jgi:glycine/D-amino acid oxidase-like deaminating enzyme/nitrite reductase/ring-hydroxylating ferredoxin subunit
MTMIEKDRTQSIWAEEQLPSFSGFSQNLKSDVCIVGAGISGVSMAYELVKRGHEVVVLEAGSIGSGQSGRTTAHLTYQLEEQFCQMLKHHSKEKVSLFMDAHKTAIDHIESNILLENISCDFKRLDGYLFLGPEDSLKTLKEEAETGRELGFDLEFAEMIPGFPQLGAGVRFSQQAQFHPMKYMGGLLRAMARSNARFFEYSRVTDFIHHKDYTEVISENGFKVTAKHVVVCTDSPVNNRYYIHTKQAAYRTYALGFKIPSDMEVPLLWDTADPYHYIRKSGDTLIIGGEDHRTGQTPAKDPYIALELWSRKYFPFVGDITWKWSGQVFEPIDQMAFVGRNPGVHKNVFITTGASGIGMTTGAIASLLIPDLIEGNPNKWQELLDPSRVSLKGAGEFIKENTNVAFQYRDWIRPSEVKKEEEIPEDHGCLMRNGLSKACVYHGQGDDFEKKSAICTHLGGIVRWNDLEKTWDCPCHGSRFNAHGNVIEGPALSNLSEL